MALPAVMIGDFQMETSEGFNDFMYELSVNFATRTIANNLYPLQQLRQDKDDEVITLGGFLNLLTSDIVMFYIIPRDAHQLQEHQD